MESACRKQRRQEAYSMGGLHPTRAVASTNDGGGGGSMAKLIW